MARRKKKTQDMGGNEWLTTYSDMMTLLLCFFVLLYSMSAIDAQKFKTVAYSIAKAFGGSTQGIFETATVGPAPLTGNPGGSNVNKTTTTSSKNERMYDNVTKFMRENKLQGKVSIKEERRGVIIELQENILFDSGKAEIKKESIPLLEKLSELLKKFANEVLVEGHTDNLPIRSGYYQSNWELSTDRAVKVVRYLAGQPGLDGSRFSAVGCGEFRPIASNASLEGRQKNRRVNILIVSTEKESN